MVHFKTVLHGKESELDMGELTYHSYAQCLFFLPHLSVTKTYWDCVMAQADKRFKRNEK